MTTTGQRLYDGMSKITPVLHGAAKAISPAEFRDALYAVCPPRFPWMRAQKPRSVGMFVVPQLGQRYGVMCTDQS
jgi:hypothetical protein